MAKSQIDEKDLLEIPAFLKRDKNSPVPVYDTEARAYEEILAEMAAAKKALTDVPAAEKPKKAEKALRKNPQERMNEQVGGYIAELEDEVDKFTIANYTSKFDLYKWLSKENVKSPQAARIAEYYRPQLAELEEAKCKSDPQLVEGYSHLNQNTMNQAITFFTMIVEDADRWSNNTRKAKRARKPRTRSIEQVVKHMKFKPADPAFKVQSVDPASIVGASELWVLHTGYVKKVGVYRAIDRGGLQINRSSIKNYDVDNSVEKRIGKNPDETIKKILEGGKVSLRKLTGSLRAKDEEPSGKINSGIILLRVIK
jgi:hypothetical protein